MYSVSCRTLSMLHVVRDRNASLFYREFVGDLLTFCRETLEWSASFLKSVVCSCATRSRCVPQVFSEPITNPKTKDPSTISTSFSGSVSTAESLNSAFTIEWHLGRLYPEEGPCSSSIRINWWRFARSRQPFRHWRTIFVSLDRLKLLELMVESKHHTWPLLEGLPG